MDANWFCQVNADLLCDEGIHMRLPWPKSMDGPTEKWSKVELASGEQT